MKTHGESGKGNRPIQSALSKKSSKSQRRRKKVRFDFARQLSPLNAALYEGCCVHCRRTGLDNTHCGNHGRDTGTQLKSQSCDNVMRLDESVNRTKPWQSVTCLVQPLSPTYDRNFSTCWMKKAGSNSLLFTSDKHRPLIQPRRGILRKSSTGLASCKKRIPTPRWVGHSNRLSAVHFKNPSSYVCSNIHNIAHSSKDFCVETPPILYKSTLGNQKPLVIEDLSHNIGRLQIANRDTKRYQGIEGSKEGANLVCSSRSNEPQPSMDMTSCACYTKANQDHFNADSDESSHSGFDTNNSSVQKRPKQEISSQAQSTSTETAILSSTLNTVTTEMDLNTRTCSSQAICLPGCPVTVIDENIPSTNNISHLILNGSLQTLHRVESSTNQISSNGFLLGRSCSSDSVVAQTFSTASTINPNFELLTNPENEIDEEFWLVVCPENSTNDAITYVENSILTGQTGEDYVGEASKKVSAHASTRIIGREESINECYEANPDQSYNSDRNHSSVLTSYNSNIRLHSSKGEVNQTLSMAHTCLCMPSTSKTASTIEFSNGLSQNAGPIKDTNFSVFNNRPFVKVSKSDPELPNCIEVDKDTRAEAFNANTCLSNLNSDETVGDDTRNKEEFYRQDHDVVVSKSETVEMTTDDGTKPLLMCCVLNCGVQFSEPSLLNEHVTQMNHSPCNPLASLIDGAEPSDVTKFLCPQCGDPFESEDQCLAHMFQVRHACLLPPVPSSVYACPECLRFFSDIWSTRQHMETLSHHGYAFHFTDDGRAPNRAQPIAVPQRLMRELVSRCRRVQYSLVCQDCGLGLTDFSELRTHLDMRHIVAAKCCTSVRDVFADLLTDQACAECGQFIYEGLPPTGMCLHTDCPFRGPVLSWPARTLREFLLRCGISGVGVGTELNLDCGYPGRHSASLLEIANPCRISEKSTTEATEPDAITPFRSLSESVLHAGDVRNTVSRLSPLGTARSSFHSSMCNRTISDASLSVSGRGVSRDSRPLWPNVELDDNINVSAAQSLGINELQKDNGRSNHVSNAPTSAICASSVTSAMPCSSTEIDSNLDLPTLCCYSSNSQENCGPPSLSSTTLIASVIERPTTILIEDDRLHESTSLAIVHQDETPVTESVPSVSMPISLDVDEKIPYSKKVFGSEASLDKSFYRSHPTSTFKVINVCDQSTQVGPDDGLSICSPQNKNQFSLSQARKAIASRLTATVIPQTDTIFLSSATEDSNELDDLTENKDNDNKEDEGSRYFAIDTRQQHIKSKSTRSSKFAFYQSRLRRTLYRRVARKIKTKKLKRCNGVAKISRYIPGRVFKNLHKQEFSSTVADQSNIFPKAINLSMSATTSSPRPEIIGNRGPTTFATAGTPLEPVSLSSSRNSESTYIIVNVKERPTEKHNYLSFTTTGFPPTCEKLRYVEDQEQSVCNIIDKNNLKFVKQEVGVETEISTEVDEANIPETDEPRYYVVKHETRPSNFHTLPYDNLTSTCKGGLPIREELCADESRYYIVTKTTIDKNSAHEEQPTCSYLYEAGPSSSNKQSSFGPVMNAQPMLSRGKTIPLHESYENTEFTAGFGSCSGPGESLGTKLALQTKITDTRVESDIIIENFHNLDRFMAVGQKNVHFGCLADTSCTRSVNGQDIKDLEADCLTLSGPQTRSRALYKSRHLLKDKKSHKKTQGAQRKSRNETEALMKVFKSKIIRRKIIRRQRPRSNKTTLKRARKLLRNGGPRKKCPKMISKYTFHAQDRFVSLRTKQPENNTECPEGVSKLQNQHRTRQYENSLYGKRQSKFSFPTSPLVILQPAMSARTSIHNSSNVRTDKLVDTDDNADVCKQSVRQTQSKVSITTKDQKREQQRSLHNLRVEPAVDPCKIGPKKLSIRTNEAESREFKKQLSSRVTLPTASQETTAQAAPRLAHSLMLSLDGPSSSRISVLSRPSTTKASRSGNPKGQVSSLTAIPGHIRRRKLRTPKIQLLSSMSSIVFADLENFMFFKNFRGQLPPSTFVWGFVSARPGGPFHREKYFRKFSLYCKLKSNKCTHVSTDIGCGKDAVDFAMTLAIAKLDDRLPATIPFFIVSNDGGFREVENQMRRAKREVKVIAPRSHCLNSARFV